MILYNGITIGYEERIDAFRRCIANIDIPQFNITKTSCPASTIDLHNIIAHSHFQHDFDFGCDDLSFFADYIVDNDIDIEDIPFLTLNITHSPDISSATYLCLTSARTKLCYEHHVCENDLISLESCIMQFIILVSNTHSGLFSYKLYKYMMATVMVWSNYFSYHHGYNTTITQNFLNTCTSSLSVNVDDCTLDLLNHCFELEYVYYYYPYWCYDSVLKRLCTQFAGDGKDRCQVVLDIRMELSLESQCAQEKNGVKCVSNVSYKSIII